MLSLNLSQLKFIAYDTFYPTNQATSTLTITFDRNPNAPTCNPPSIVQTLDLQALPGAVVGKVTATDPEGVNVAPMSCVIFFSFMFFKNLFADMVQGAVIVCMIQGF